MESLKRWGTRILVAVAIAVIASALAYSLPVDFALLIAVDVTAYFEALFGVYLFSQVAPWRVVASKARVKLLALAIQMLGAPQRRMKRDTRKRVQRLPQADNDDRPALIAAAA